MSHERFRYFIELQPDVEPDATRARETELRRAIASEFVLFLREWLDDNDLESSVGAVDVTAFGQIHITCTADVIRRIREENLTDIAAIRPTALIGDGLALPGRARARS